MHIYAYPHFICVYKHMHAHTLVNMHLQFSPNYEPISVSLYLTSIFLSFLYVLCPLIPPSSVKVYCKFYLE